MEKDLKILRRWILFFMISLFLSGLTALPLEWELEIISRFFPSHTLVGSWLDKVYDGLYVTNREYPFLAYGYDWLAFAHFVLALLFIGPLKDPVRNKWIIEFAMYACVLIIPFALVAGYDRGIPFWWQMIDCSFGIIGLIPLIICLRKIKHIEKINSNI